MRHSLHIALLVVLGTTALAQQSRIAEITEIEGVRQNIVRGIGLVVGLNKTGDRSQLGQRMIASIMKNNRINASISELGSQNAAVVMVTATIDPFKRPGSRIDVTVSSIQDAKSLFGGVLMETHLTGFDRKTVYGIAEGPLSVGGLGATGASGSSITVNHPT
ncbi:MAG: flagellar basal body P-ring protein FlgI, partial [Pirellulaceae bacterium]|nr:flagellar basal body P-ring protein FlgI [Pirellulaceae bacterium]